MDSRSDLTSVERRTERLLETRWVIQVKIDSPGRLDHLWIRVPGLREQPDERQLELLTWQYGHKDSYTPVSWILDEFLSLADGEAHKIWEFARRYGPLAGFSGTTSSPEGFRSQVESVHAWRLLASALQALLNIGANDGPVAPETGQTWARAINAPLIAEAIRKHWKWPFPHIHGNKIFPMQNSDGGQESYLSPDAIGTSLWAIEDALLSAAGIRQIADASDLNDPGNGYAISVHVFENVMTYPNKPLLVVGGLLPVLAFQAVASHRTIKGRQCSVCEKWIPYSRNVKKPRFDRAYFGNHDECRRKAKLKAKRESQRRSYQKKRAVALATAAEVRGDVTDV